MTVTIIGNEQILDGSITEPKLYILTVPSGGNILVWSGGMYWSNELTQLQSISFDTTYSGPHINITGQDILINTDVGKTIVLNSVVYDDVSVDISNVRLPVANAPTWTAYKGSQVLAFTKNADEIIYFTVQLPHKYASGRDIEFHIHTAYPDGNSGNSIWNFTYSWASIGDDFPTETSTQVTLASPENQDSHEIHEIVSSISGTDKNISSILLCSLEREGTNISDDYDNSIYVVSLDFHVPLNTLGSRLPTSK